VVAEQEEQTMPGIVVGVDGSLNCERALDRAMKAAAAQHAPLTVVLAAHEVMKSYWTGKPVHDQYLGLTTSGRRS
jgi:nucleotide-binding universal stress UspA family protein